MRLVTCHRRRLHCSNRNSIWTTVKCRRARIFFSPTHHEEDLMWSCDRLFGWCGWLQRVPQTCGSRAIFSPCCGSELCLHCGYCSRAEIRLAVDFEESAPRVQVVYGCWKEKTALEWNWFWEGNWGMAMRYTKKRRKGGRSGQPCRGPPPAWVPNLPVWPERTRKGLMTRGLGFDE